MRSIEALACSAIARVEVPAAIWRKQRLEEISAEDAQVLVAAFEADYYGTDEDGPRFAVIALTDTCLRGAARLAAVHPLRAYDAVQLASALAAREADDDCSWFAGFDAELNRAAAAEGFELLAATDPQA